MCRCQRVSGLEVLDAPQEVQNVGARGHPNTQMYSGKTLNFETLEKSFSLNFVELRHFTQKLLSFKHIWIRRRKFSFFFPFPFLIEWTKSNETKWCFEDMSRRIQNGTIRPLTRPQSWDYPLPNPDLISSRDLSIFAPLCPILTWPLFSNWFLEGMPRTYEKW